MDKQRNALRAGGVIVAGVVLTVAVIVAIKGVDRIIEPMQVREVCFKLTDDIGGLRVGDDVRIGGFKVGVIRSIQVAGENKPSDQDRIVAAFSMPRKYVLHEDAHVAIQGTLTGTSWLNFDNLGQGPMLAENQPLTGRPSRSNEVIAQIASMAPEVKATLGEIRTKTLPAANDALARISATADSLKETGAAGAALLQMVRGQIEPIVNKYHLVADRTAEMMTHARDLLGESKGDLRTTAANLKSATGNLKDKLPGVLDQVNDVLVKMSQSASGINLALQDVQSTIGNARELSAAARSVLVGNKGKLDAIIASVKTTTDNLKHASVEIRRSPWRLLYKPTPGEMGNLNLYDTARQFAQGASELGDASTALRDALNNPQASKEDLQKLMDQVEKTYSHFQSVEQKLWKSVKE